MRAWAYAACMRACVHACMRACVLGHTGNPTHACLGVQATHTHRASVHVCMRSAPGEKKRGCRSTPDGGGAKDRNMRVWSRERSPHAARCSTPPACLLARASIERAAGRMTTHALGTPRRRARIQEQKYDCPQGNLRHHTMGASTCRVRVAQALVGICNFSHAVVIDHRRGCEPTPPTMPRSSSCNS